MLLPRNSNQWKAAKARLPPVKAVIAFVAKPRFLLLVAIFGIILLLWRGITSSASEMQK